MAESTAYATADDVATLYRELTSDEVLRADAILPLISDMIRAEYELYTGGGDYDEYLESHTYLQSTVKAVVCDVCFRFLRSSTTGESMTQESQGGLGYTWSGTYAVPGGGLANAFMERDWKRLRVHRPMIRSVRYDYGS